jgi:hypothetical protein
VRELNDQLHIAYTFTQPQDTTALRRRLGTAAGQRAPSCVYDACLVGCPSRGQLPPLFVLKLVDVTMRSVINFSHETTKW